MSRDPIETPSRRLIVPAAFALGLLYLGGLAPTVHVHDAGELTAAAWTLGLAHPPGAPLYMVLAKVFMTLVPYGHIAWRANLLSALLAVALFVLLTSWAERRGLGAFGAIITGAVAALAPTLWSQALMAEVYTLQALLLAGVFMSLDLETRPEITALLWGLLLSCHIGLAPLTPMVLVLLVLPHSGWKTRLQILIRVTIATGLPLLLYAYIPLRSMADPAINWSSPKTLKELWWYLSNANVRARSFSLPLAAYLARAGEFGLILFRNAHLALVPSVIGLVISQRRRTAFLALSVILFDAAFVVLLDTAPLESEAYGIPAIVSLVILVGLGLEVLGRRPQMRRALMILMVGAMALSSWRARGQLDLSHSFVVRDTTEAILSQTPDGAVLFTQEDNTTFPLAYLMAIEGARPDLEVFDRAGNLFQSPYDQPLHRIQGDLAAFRKEQEEPLVTEILAEGRDIVYTAPFLEFEPQSWRLQACGTIARVVATNATSSPDCLSPPPPRSPEHPDWMSRQILAMDAVKRAAFEVTTGAKTEATIHLHSALELSDITELDLRIAQLALESGDLETAASASARALPELPSSTAAAMIAARVAIRNEKWHRAETDLGRALDLEPERVEAWINRGLVRKRLGDLQGAADDLDEAAALDPAGPAPLLLIQMLVRSGAPRGKVVEALCTLGGSRPPAFLEPQELTEVLMIAARAGAPECVTHWLEAGDLGENAEIATAYLAATGTGELR